MLPKKYRLSKKEFQQVKDRGQLISGCLMGILVFLPPASRLQSSPAKAGLIVSKKLSLQATTRNRLKRRLRAALCRVLPAIKFPAQLVILPNKKALAAKVGDLETEIKSLIKPPKNFNLIIFL